MCVFRAIGWKHPRDWMCPFPRHISHSSGGLKVQCWKILKLICTQILFLGFKAGRTIICYSVWVVVKLFVTRFHCICPDYHHIAIVWWLQKRTLKLEHLRMRKRIGQQRRFENSHSNSGLKEKSEGAVEMADSILRYFSQRLLSPLALLQS